MSKPSVLARVASALRVLRGEDGAAERAIAPVTYPNFVPGTAQAALVRTANPGEYKWDGATVRAQGFNKHPVVHACIRVIADLVASVPLVVERERGNSDSRVGSDHPLQQLLDFPAPRFTARQFRARFAVDLLGYGNAMFQMERAGRRIRALRSINPESVQCVWVDAEGDPRRYDYGNWSGILINVDAEDVLHFRDLDMERPFAPAVFGYPRGASALQSLFADNEAGHYVRQVVTNDGTPTFAVMLADEATQADAQAMQDRYTARVVDRGKRGTPAFFGGVKDIKPLGFTLSDLEFPDLRRVSREDICAAFGVDPRMIGIASASNDAGLSGTQYVEARARLVQHTVEPMFSVLEDELNHWLAPEFGDVYVTYDRDVLRDLVENDEATSKRIIEEVKVGLRTMEEAREAIQLPPKYVPTDTVMVGAFQLVPAAQAVTVPATTDVTTEDATEVEEPDDEAEDDVAEVEDDDEASGEERSRSDALSVDEQGRPWWVHLPKDQRPRRQPTEEEKYAYWQRAVGEMDRREREFYGAAIARFSAEEAQVIGWLTPSRRQVPDYDAFLAAVTAAYAEGGEFYEAWVTAYRSLVGRTFINGARSVGGGGVNLGFDFTLQSPDVMRAVDARLARLAQLIGEETAKQVTAVIRIAELGGLSVRETAAMIREAVYGEAMTTTRATRIARTEAAGAMSQGAWDQAQAMGDLYVAKEWLSFEDAKTRETHRDASLQGIIPIAQAFGNGLQYPLDPNGTASEVINCRCVLAYYDTLTGD